MVQPLAKDLAGAPLALLTRHGKETLLAPILEPALGVRLVHVDSVDTDLLGTFTRETPREGSQRDAARKKARLGAELAGCRFAVASEGAFVTDPWTGMLPWNIEMVLFLDTDTGLEVTGMAQGGTVNRHQSVPDWAGLQAFAASAGFPAHALVMRPGHADHPHVIKGLTTEAALRQAFDETLALSATGEVFVEHDLRAHHHPTRREMIAKAAANLVERLRSLWPACGQPDFWVAELVAGLPCRWCREPTPAIRAERWCCPACQHEDIRPRAGEPFADPSRCGQCNP
jgi:hypothetical protein